MTEREKEKVRERESDRERERERVLGPSGTKVYGSQGNKCLQELHFFNEL